MVVILQQTTDNGKRFVSTVVKEEVSLTSGFSGLSSNQNSISERSANYKQRIDSLFLIPKSSQIFTQHYFPEPNSKTQPSKLNKSSDSSSDEGYQRIDEEMLEQFSSVIPDSLNLRTNIPNARNVSKVKLNSDSLTDPSSNGSSSSENGSGRLDQIWKDGTYSNAHIRCCIDLPQEIQSKKIFDRFPSTSGNFCFPVEYLGSIPVEGTTTTLQQLQKPLCTLYLNFLTKKNIMGGQLSITDEGLRFESKKLRIVNPFNTISVWAAIKFVARGESVPNEFAFMPLISDPEGQQKRRLFGIMDSEFLTTYLSSISGQGFRNPPIFTCIMREASFSLECHAFTCKCAEDAIVIAANLYQSLVTKLKIHKEGESGYGTLTHSSPSTTNQNSPIGSRNDTKRIMPPAFTSKQETIVEQKFLGSTREHRKQHRVAFTDSDTVAPVRPPRHRKKFGDTGTGHLKSYNSDESLFKLPNHRRKSFKVHSSHPLQRRYHPRSNKKRVKITTPDEVESSGVNESIDKILDRIINPGRMSFKDLKPTYQELILKIALTLTQDQLYQKSKEAMEKQKYTPSVNTKKLRIPSDKSDENFLGNLFKPFSKISSSKKGGDGKRKELRNPLIGGSKSDLRKVILKKGIEEENKFLSICSGCMCENCSEKCYCSLPSKQNMKSVGLASVNPSVESTSAYTIKERHFAEINEANKKLKPRKIGEKGCGYASDSCAESEKCYCSLQGQSSNGLKIYNINLDTETSDTDTNSYDLESFNEKLTDRNHHENDITFSKPVEILSYHPSKRFSSNQVNQCCGHSSQIQKSNENPPKTILPSKKKNTIKSKIDENITQPNKSESLDEDTSRCRNSPSLRQRKKVLLITGSSNPSTELIYKDQTIGGGEEKHKLGNIIEHDTLEDSETTETSKRDSEESIDSHVLEMKKTAEIKAMFSNEKRAGMNERPSIHKKKEITKLTRPPDFQTSLGYLP